MVLGGAKWERRRGGKVKSISHFSAQRFQISPAMVYIFTLSIDAVNLVRYHRIFS